MLLSRANFLIRISMVILLVAGLLLPGVVSTNDSEASGRSRYTFRRAERCMMKKINKRRARHDLRSLNWDRQLGYVARKHAARMARHGSIFHDGALGSRVTRWKRLGDNVGMAARGCRALFKAFWRSSSHQDNILGRWRFVGVGAKRRNGAIYVHQVFESRRNPGNIYTYP